MKTIACLVAVIGIAGSAQGQSAPPAHRESLYDHTYKKGDASSMGVGFMIGGGLTNFTDAQVRNALQLGGGWEARLIFGTRAWLGLEVAYNGSVNDINSVGLSGNTKLLGTGVQTLARANLTGGSLIPYVVAGAGWRHYALVYRKFNVSAIRNDDSLVEIPMGGGIAYHVGAIMVDVRGMYNYALDTSMFTPNGEAGSNGAQLHNWGARLNLGFEL